MIIITYIISSVLYKSQTSKQRIRDRGSWGKSDAAASSDDGGAEPVRNYPLVVPEGGSKSRYPSGKTGSDFWGISKGKKYRLTRRNIR